MTIRLVGLMSLVLLLSLGALALLMGSYHGDVMDEVTRTISLVGRATLGTFEFPMVHGEPTAPAEGLRQERVLVRRLHPPGAEPGAAGEARGFVIVSTLHGDGGPDPSAAPAPPGAAPGSGEPEVLVARAGGTWQLDASEGAVGASSLLIRVEEVHAERDPDAGTVLRIPALERMKEEAEGGAPDDRFVWATSMGDLPAKTALREFVLPIPTDEFQDLFAAFRARTLLLFLGVFLVGTVLSASLAAHFTRPIRKLDAGIRRLTAGDLDVEVEARGRDEVGRLARAFNEMARRLRASRERERELTRREKLSALGRLAAGVAHDVRNPLHSIGLTLQNLQETSRPQDDARGREFDRSLAIIRDEVRRLDRLVENFLRFARSDRRAKVATDLPALLRETAALVEKEAERRGVALRVEAPPGIPPVPAEVESIQSSILNLVLNSFEAMEGGGTLTLRLRPAAGEVLVEVEDTGRGIPPEEQEKVFEFAYSTREDGHGLGLAMVHQVVVEDHGGRVCLESRPGEGTLVRLALPRPEAAA